MLTIKGVCMKYNLMKALEKLKHPAVVVILFWVLLFSLITLGCYAPFAAIVTIGVMLVTVVVAIVSWLIYEAAKIFLDMENC